MLYYFDYKLGKRVTGANLYYKRISEILKAYGQATPIKNFFGFISSGIKRLKPGDTLITNNGPYAFIFHYLRKFLGLRFRIVRDVQATLHTSYLFQELACADLIQPDDVALFPSNYTRNLYIKLFEHLTAENTFVCYPCIESFPKLKPKPKPRELVIGYLGRCSYEKNFHQLLNIAPKLRHRILVVGELSLPITSLPSNLVLLGELPYHRIWDFLQQISVLVFPSTANIESLGRVLLEANHAGVPCVASEFGASPELCPNLVGVSYTSQEVELVHNHPLGLVDEAALLQLLSKNRLKLGSNTGYLNHDKKLMKILNSSQKEEPLAELNPRVAEFVNKTKIYINQEYNYSTIDAIRAYIALLKKEDITDIGITTHNISEQLGFTPKWKLC
ncbi:glycosyltransferase family 4 protein [Candidatus Woesearchaeota archaeon]|nr:glycosyltransferase family 4 protein [Candidatus Woesearchaeota archaeon]